MSFLPASSIQGDYAALLTILLRYVLALAALSCAPAAQGVEWPIDLLKRYGNSAVLIKFDGGRVDETKGPPPSGSGFFVDERGTIVTAHHIFPDANEFLGGEYRILALINPCETCFDWDKALQLERVRDLQFPLQDIAVLRVTNRNGRSFVPVQFDPTITLIGGSSVMVMGYPKGDLLRHSIGTLQGQPVQGLYRTEGTAVDKGNSGGPAFARDGRLLGILRAGIERSDNKAPPGADGFAAIIPASTMAKVVPRSVQDQWRMTTTPFQPDEINNIPDEIREFVTIDRLKVTQPGTATRSCNWRTDIGLSVPTLCPPSERYSEVYRTREGYQIKSAALEVISNNRVCELADRASDCPDNKPRYTLRTAADRKSVTLTFSLSSGPLFNAERAWLRANLVLNQRRDN